MAEDPFYVRDTIAMLRPYELDGRWAGRLSKMRILKAQIIEGGDASAGGKSPPLLASIDEAVERINNGTYGVCASCGKSIQEDRVRMESPWITRCPDCRVKK